MPLTPITPFSGMRPIPPTDIDIAEPVIHVWMAEAECFQRFGPAHAVNPPDHDAPGPVGLWFFELPWGHRIAIECFLTKDFIHVYLGCLEIEAVIAHLGLNGHEHQLIDHSCELLRTWLRLEPGMPQRWCLMRQDDNGNVASMHEYESERVALYHQAVYSARGHKQLYWVEAGGCDARRTD